MKILKAIVDMANYSVNKLINILGGKYNGSCSQRQATSRL